MVQVLYHSLPPVLAGMSTHELAGMSLTCYAHDVSSGLLDSMQRRASTSARISCGMVRQQRLS